MAVVTNERVDASVVLHQAWQTAIVCHRAGRTAEAEALYAAILKVDAGNPGANHNLGVLRVAAGDYEVAVKHLMTAIETDPAEAQYWLSLVAALHAAKRYDEAEQALRLAREHGLAGDEAERLAGKIGEARQAVA